MALARSRTRPHHLAILWLAVAVAAIGKPDVAHAQAATGTIRVAPSGSDFGGCGAIAAPCRTLQFANDQFALGATGTIRVAAGTYTSSDPRQVLRVTQRTITIQGGYTTAFTAPNYAANVVTIDGENARKGFLVDCPIASPNPCQFTLVGVTVTRCNAALDIGTLNAFGGGLDTYLANIGLYDVAFIGNTARGVGANSGLPGDAGGGAVSFRQSFATLARVRFENNTAQGGDGTGSAVRGGLGVGGGIFSFMSMIAMSEITATGNVARAGDAPSSVGLASGQRADGLGGFLALILGSGTQTITGLVATNNRAEGGDATQYGGLGLGGAIMIQIAPLVEMESITLEDNVAIGGGGDGSLGGGGAIIAEDVHLHIDRGTVIGNLAQGGNGTHLGGTGGGGGIYTNAVTTNYGLGTDLQATNLIVARNDAVAGSGATKGYAFGGGIFVQCPGGGPGPSYCGSPTTTSTADLAHVTLADNTVSNADYNQGGALWVGIDAVVDVSNSIVSGHTTPTVPGFDRGEAVLTYGATTFATTLWNDNTAKVFVVPGESFLDGDPRSGSPEFVNPFAELPDYHIQASSAARDQIIDDTVLVDLDENLRPDSVSGISDLGADEFVVPEPTATLLQAAAWGIIAALRRISRARLSPGRR